FSSGDFCLLLTQVDEDNCAIGYYMPFIAEEGAVPEIQFRPLATGLQTDYAQTLSSKLGSIMQAKNFGEADPLLVYIETVKRLTSDEREDITLINKNTPSVTPDFDL
ncbi:MAG: hypothetical protein AAFR67_12310, partial [Chloroflexota bacterium]